MIDYKKRELSWILIDLVKNIVIVGKSKFLFMCKCLGCKYLILIGYKLG